MGIGIVTVAALLLLGAATESRADVTVAQCRTEWAESSADDTCSNEQFYLQGGNDCTIVALCETTQNTIVSGSVLRSDSIRVHVDSVSSIQNCNGYLRVGDCS